MQNTLRAWPLPQTFRKRYLKSAGIFLNCDCRSLWRGNPARMKVYLARESKIPRLLELEANVGKLSRANSHWQHRPSDESRAPRNRSTTVKGANKPFDRSICEPDYNLLDFGALKNEGVAALKEYSSRCYLATKEQGQAGKYRLHRREKRAESKSIRRKWWSRRNIFFFGPGRLTSGEVDLSLGWQVTKGHPQT
jgi:hypothetical protein